MSAQGSGIDLSGDWTGVFNYPESLPATGFEATLRDVGGLITGVTVEPGDALNGSGGILHAVIDGRRDGMSVQFVKIYDESTDARDLVRYRGEIDPGGDEIAGHWEIPGDWSGTFLMVRAQKAAEAVERQVVEPVEPGR